MQSKNHYILKCSSCGAEYDDNPGEWRLKCDKEGSEHGPALMCSVFSADHPLDPKVDATAARFSPWLAYRSPDPEHPGQVPEVLRTTSLPATFRSTKFGEEKLGLRNLWVSFCGFWPERGSTLASCSFKELEASCIAARLEGMPPGVGVVVSSAGNTARAFAQIFSQPGMKRTVVIVAPEKALPSLWSPAPFTDNVKLIAVADGDYFDAIRLADLIAEKGKDFLISEGGARNNARRDGMSLALLAAAAAAAAASATGSSNGTPLPVPRHYFQAIGSGTGGIAAWEGAQRLVKHAGCEGKSTPPTLTKLHLSQNVPFTPMFDAWEKNGRSRVLPEYCNSDSESKARISEVSAFVLTNRKPPYGICGGVYDALTATDGTMYAVTNEEAAKAAALFEESEGIDVDPAAAVAVAHLCYAAEKRLVDPDDFIVLNVTGGGKKHLFESSAINYLKPVVTVKAADISSETALKIVEAIKC